MSEFLNAITAHIQTVLNERPSSVYGQIIAVDTVHKSCTVRYPNPTGSDDIITANVRWPRGAGGIHGTAPEVGQYVTLTIPQGGLYVPSISELRYPEDNPLLEREAESVKRTGVTAVRLQRARPR